MQLTLRTAEVPERDRVDYWQGAMDRVLNARCAIEPRRGTSFHAAMGVLRCADVELIELKGSPYTSTRAGPGRCGRVSIMLQLDGFGIVRDAHRTARLAPGGMCLIPPDREIVAERLGQFRQVIVDLAATAIDDCVPGWRDATALTLPSPSPWVSAASDLVCFVLEHHAALETSQRIQVTEAAVDLLAKALASAGGGPERRSPRPETARLGAFHRRRIEDILRARLRDPELSVAGIARETRLSTRYIHRLFEAGQSTVMRRVTELRLDACLADLQAHDGRTIGAIAYSWGFNSTAHFCRAFRKRFGTRPSDV